MEHWPETEVFDDISRRIWTTLHQGAIEADLAYSALDERQSTLQRDLYASVRQHDLTITRATTDCSDTLNAALKRLTRAEDNLAISIGSLSTLNENMANTFDAQSKTLDEITKGLQRQTDAMAEIDKRLQTHSGILSRLTGKAENHDNRLNGVSNSLAFLETRLPQISADTEARVQGVRKVLDTETTSLRTDVMEIRARLIPDLRREVHSLDGALREALTRLPSSTATSEFVIGVDNATGLAPAGTNSTSDPVVGADTVTDSTGDPVDEPIVDGPNVRFHGPPMATSPAPQADSSWFHSGNCVNHVTPGPARDRRPPHLSTLDTSPRDPMLGGAYRAGDKEHSRKIISPRVGDREQFARERQLSRFDITGLATPGYHGELDGVDELTIPFLHECGYNSFAPEAPEDVLLCYRDIQLVHRKVLSGWENTRSGRSGPPIEYIVEKAVPHFPKLTSLDARAAVDFYDRLQKISAGYLLPLMPFDAIKLSFNFEGLCPPGLGTLHYGEIGSALMDILPRLLPKSIPEINSAITTVGFESNNGYDLFWRVLELTTPGFNPTIPILPPTWSRDSELFEFCQAYLLYFRLQSKKNNHFDARTRSCIFLRAISQTDYADIATLLQAQLDSFCKVDDDGYVPHHLRLSGLTTMLHNNAMARVQDFATPRINKLGGMESVWDLVDDDELPFCHVQGYEPRVLRLEQGRDRGQFQRGQNRDFRHSRNADHHEGPPPRGRDHDRRKGLSFRDLGQGGGRSGDRGPGRGRPSKIPRDRPVRPDQRRHPFLPGVICAACKRTGHEASSCDMLAIALFVERHKNQLSDSEKSSIEDKWVARWKDKIGQPTRTPRQVMRTYCEDLDISPDHLAQAMDWECWPTSDDSSLDLE